MAGATDPVLALRERKAATRQRARRAGPALFLAALALPIALWHRHVSEIASEFDWSARYLVTGWLCWALMALGLVCFVVAAIVDVRNRDRRFYGSGTAAWAGWGITLYLLGFGLATQVAQITDSFRTY
jgi:hypothetical protein